MAFKFNATYVIISLYFLLSGVEYGKSVVSCLTVISD